MIFIIDSSVDYSLLYQFVYKLSEKKRKIFLKTKEKSIVQTPKISLEKSYFRSCNQNTFSRKMTKTRRVH